MTQYRIVTNGHVYGVEWWLDPQPWLDWFVLTAQWVRYDEEFATVSAARAFVRREQDAARLAVAPWIAVETISEED